MSLQKMDRQEPSRVRQGGTIVVSPANGAERIAAVLAVVDQQQFAKIDGCMADLWSCSCIKAVYNALNSENQAKLSALAFPKMAAVAFKVMK